MKYHMSPFNCRWLGRRSTCTMGQLGLQRSGLGLGKWSCSSQWHTRRGWLGSNVSSAILR